MKILTDLDERRKYPDNPLTFPDQLLNESHALHIHGQTLERLNERGGLGIEEIVLNVKQLPYSALKTLNYDDCLQQVKEWINELNKEA